MKLQQSLNYINQALNYPALNYEDISLFFDAAIAELNTTLHTNIPTISKMIDEFKQYMSKNITKVLITGVDPSVNYEIPSSTVQTSNYYYNPSDKKFYVLNVATGAYTAHDNLYGTYLRNGVPETYEAIVYGQQASWQITDVLNVQDCELSYYLPEEWVLLWLIPYVCFKYTVRDGGTASTFAEELTQGFQQLQETYDVPEKVVLATVADKKAYMDLVKENLPNLNVVVKTRAIYENMKHNRALNAVYGSMYDRGGF